MSIIYKASSFWSSSYYHVMQYSDSSVGNILYVHSHTHTHATPLHSHTHTHTHTQHTHTHATPLHSHTHTHTHMLHPSTHSWKRTLAIVLQVSQVNNVRHRSTLVAYRHAVLERGVFRNHPTLLGTCVRTVHSCKKVRTPAAVMLCNYYSVSSASEFSIIRT